MPRTQLSFPCEGRGSHLPRTLFVRSLREQAGKCTLRSPTVFTALHTAPAPCTAAASLASCPLQRAASLLFRGRYAAHARRRDEQKPWSGRVVR